MTRYVYVYAMAGEPQLIRAAAPGHTEYWHALRLAGYAGGPFGDRSGGLITFLADDEEAARQAVAGDPFTLAGVIGESQLKAWEPVGVDHPLAPVLHANSR
jgi:uncharacterized protein YciI